jgi:hypothetical protein
VSEPSSAQDSFKGRHFDKVFDFELFFKREYPHLIPTGMCCRFLALVVVLLPLIAGCEKPQKQIEINLTTTPATDSSTAPAAVDHSRMTLLCTAPTLSKLLRWSYARKAMPPMTKGQSGQVHDDRSLSVP